MVSALGVADYINWILAFNGFLCQMAQRWGEDEVFLPDYRADDKLQLAFYLLHACVHVMCSACLSVNHFAYGH